MHISALDPKQIYPESDLIPHGVDTYSLPAWLGDWGLMNQAIGDEMVFGQRKENHHEENTSNEPLIYLSASGGALPDEPQGIQPEPGLLQGRCQFLLLGFGQLNFLRSYVAVHPLEGLQALDLIAEQMIHFFQSGLPQGGRLSFGQLTGCREHRRQFPLSDVGIFDELVGRPFLKSGFPHVSLKSFGYVREFVTDEIGRAHV